ncbi:MAG: toxin-antitoxin system YwqK family antitoxin [Hyphomicrobiales bacterium]
MKNYILSFLSFLIVINIYSQQNVNNNGYNVFYYPNGVKSSEGNLVNGQPEGYWKTYNEKEVLISEGNRKNHLLDSLWSFYNDTGKIVMQVYYEKGIKNGIRTTWLKNEIRKENFINDRKEGDSKIFYKSGKLKQLIPYYRGLEDGVSKVYDLKGNIIELITYDRAYVVERERINRYDSNEKRHGKWKWFFHNGNVSKMGKYKHGIEDGFFVEFNLDGSVKNSIKYINGEIQNEEEIFGAIRIEKEYFPSGRLKAETVYSGKEKHGINKLYNEQGNIIKAEMYKKGQKISEGIVSKNGLRQGEWEEFYPDSTLKAKGSFLDDNKFGEWVYYFSGGKTEQRGRYGANGLPHGKWVWFYPNGKIHRTEYYNQGNLHGEYKEYDINGKPITFGKYVDGKKEGAWRLVYGDHIEEGSFYKGKPHGKWKYFYNDNKLSFQGKFAKGIPHGIHTWYNAKGIVVERGKFIMGRKDGTWSIYNDDGSLLIFITYENGKEIKYDGIKIDGF